MSLATFESEQLKFHIPSGIMIGGPASSGKTTFVQRLLHHYKEMFEPIPLETIYCYGEYGTHIPELEKNGIQTFEGPPDEELLRRPRKPFLLVIDDMMLSIDETFLNNIFTKKSHHGNFGVIFITQNMFDKKLKVARQNSQYLVLMRSPNTALQVRILGQQFFPGKVSQFMDVYQDCTKELFGYLVIDTHAITDSQLRLRTNIFPNELSSVYLL